MSNHYDPFHELTPDNQGPFVVVVSISLIVITLCVTAIRFEIAHRSTLEFSWDDVSFLIATGFAVATSVCFYRAVLAGLGKHQRIISPHNLSTYYKLTYACQFLGVAAMGAAKISVAMLFKRIASPARSFFVVPLSLAAIWVMFSVFSLAFQCSSSEPWVFQPSHCSTHGYLQYAVIVLNMLTDTMLSFGVLPTVWRLQMQKSTRMLLVCLFASRILVPLLAVGQIVAVSHSLHSTDQTWSETSLAIWVQFVIHISVITSTIPRTNSFWASLGSGKSGTHIKPYEIELSESSRNGKQKWQSTVQSRRFGSRFDLSAAHPLTRFTPGAESCLASRISASNGPSRHQSHWHDKDSGDQALIRSQMDEETSQSSLNDDGQSGNPNGIWQTHDLRVEVEFQNKENNDHDHARR